MYYNEFTFYDCGLDIEHNLLEAPTCPCGCGSKGNIVADDEMDICQIARAILEDVECQYCAIFIIKQNYQVVCVTKEADGGYIYVCNPDCVPVSLRETMNIVSEFQDAFKFHCYGLLVEIDDDEEEMYKVIED